MASIRVPTVLLLISLSVPCKTQLRLMQFLYEMTNRFNGSIPDTNQYLPAYDFIIIGSGSGGSVMANRLSEVKDWKILLLEVGDEENFLTDVPLTPGVTQVSRFNWGYKTEKQTGACTALKGGVCNWPKGRAVGGTSVINFMLYQRGHRKDFDGWAAAGNDGWSYDEVLPYFLKSEKVDPMLEGMEKEFHGTNGYLNVENARFKTPLVDAFLEAGKEFGYQNSDPNGESLVGFSRAQATLRNGRRCSAAKAFIRPAMHRTNLHISMKSWVTKIIVDPVTKTATAVEFLKNKKRYRVRTRKEVILSAGTIASPQLLMLSGIGPREHLRNLNIPVIQDLKVGYNLQDHVTFNGLDFLVDRPVTINERNVQNPVHVLDYVFRGVGPYTIPGGAEGLAFVKTSNSTFAADYPDIEIVLGAGGLSGDTSGTLRNILGITDEFYNKVYKNIMGKNTFELVPVLMRPRSRGRLSLKSTNPFHWPRLEPNFYTDRNDLVTLIEGIRLVGQSSCMICPLGPVSFYFFQCLQIAKTRRFRELGTRFHTAPFPGCEIHPFGSDEYWECCIRKYASSLQHQVGTCKMGPSYDLDAVVNPQLQVHGVPNLRVVDGSVIPVIPAAHTNAAIFMIGEKGADMVKEFWKYRGNGIS
ncbi:Glucose dehydrogenase [FAD, quinone] [Pseudolycoriella hygida]|uniref:Glucose dehydrogenase [FAD, quinone] n=1 Tax=Pseudolycoriella hygida TaxID=35572 RepID=A0A9Q0RXP3_9DIPT|nr:Glucose dehydrogenase [FAD, quinone] [Pseudolycoriella hygida]